VVDKTALLNTLGFVHGLSAVHQLGAVFHPSELQQNQDTATTEQRMLAERLEKLDAICRNAAQDVTGEEPTYKHSLLKLFYLDNTNVELIKFPV
jgi:hypothetical protein